MTSSAVFEAPAPEEISNIIPGFSVGHLLATGADSAVYLAIQTSLERQVALRIYSPASSADPDRVRAVEATTRAMAKLKHRNLIGLFDSGTREGMMYVVMEFVAGKPLARSLAGGAVHHTQVKSIMTGVCEGLAYAHLNKIAHGRLDESVILLNPDAEPKIGGFLGGDFGEHKEADIIAVGRLLYLMLTGVEDTPRSVEPSVVVGSPAEYDEIWMRCVRRDRKDAFESVQDIVDALAKPRKMSAHAAAPAAAAAAGGLPKQAAMPSSSHWPLIRNLVLIVVLVIAIIKVWGMMQRKERDILRQHEEEARKQAAEQERKYQEALNAKSPNKPKRPIRAHRNTPGQSPEPIEEIREAPLADIRESLASGKRDTLPTGSVRRGDSAYLLVRDLLSWPEASWFAERHGAHLVIPEEGADLAWLQSIADGQPYWLGAGRSARSGKNTWHLVDGDEWKPEKEPAGVGKYLAADKFGFLRAAGDSVRLPCILQWRMNGTNPGQLEDVLVTSARTLDSEEPVYPPGTDFLGDQAYLVVSRDVDWEGAMQLAETAGGMLAAASSAAEVLHLQDMARDFTAGKPHWVGARRNKSGWTWNSGDAWRNLRISGDSGTVDAALAVSSDGGWLAMNAGEQAAGFIIEWGSQNDAANSTNENPKSKPKPGKPEVNDDNPSQESISVLDAKAKSLVQTALDTREKELNDNAFRMRSYLDSVYRNMNKTLQRQWFESMNKLKGSIKDNRVPEDLSVSGIRMTEEMARIALNAATKQKNLDAEFLTTVNEVREAYHRRVSEMMTKADESNDKQTIRELQSKLEASEKLETWLKEFGFSPGK